MSLIGLINSDEGIEKRVRSLFENEGSERFSLHVAKSPAMVKEVLNFDLPEIVIINLCDPDINFKIVFDQIKQDLWLHTFGIVGLYDSSVMDDKSAAAELKDYNVLALLDVARIEHNLLKYIRIIDANQQLIFQFDLADKLNGIITGSLVIDNDLSAIPVYTSLALASLFQHGYIGPDRKMDLYLVLQELIINAVEHGNCRITYDEKTRWLDTGKNIADLVVEKCKDEIIAARKIHIEWEISSEKSKFSIRDDGDGFNVEKYVKEFREKNEALHGRGIIIAKSLVKRLAYNRKGNMVSFTVAHDMQVLREEPVGFKGEDVLFPAAGDVIFREGENSDFLYYVSSGTYTASLEGTPVGTIDPGDIFMGEMAFLLNNKRTVTVTANSRGKLVKVPRLSFVEIVREYPHYGIFLAKLIARKLARANRENARMRVI